jgi:hypothetical protein
VLHESGTSSPSTSPERTTETLVNFYAHACVALWRSADPRFLFGAMVPDLTGMMGLRYATSSDAALNAGIELHHATDAAFHSAGHFVALCASGVAELTEHGVGRGAARAVAHVGTELLLDGHMSHDRHARSAYENALSFAVAHELASTLALSDARDRERLHAGIARLRVAPLPEGYREPAFVLDRLEHILLRRPRLALQPADHPHVARFLERVRTELDGNWRELLEQVRAALPPTA